MEIPVATWTPAHEPLAYEAVYDELRRAVMSGELAGGSRLSEPELAARLAVSRTPVREALRRLESDGLVIRSPVGGLVVTETGPDDLGDIGLLRIEVDGLAARLAASRGTAADWDDVFERVERLRVAPDERVLAREHHDLHRAIYAVGFSPRLASVFSVHLLPYIEEAVNVGPGFGADPLGSYRQHHELVSILAAGDPDAAEAASREHARSGVTYAKARRAPAPVPPASSPEASPPEDR
jgi:DNA-binding GntR family transcriptional regulator